MRVRMCGVLHTGGEKGAKTLALRAAACVFYEYRLFFFLHFIKMN